MRFTCHGYSLASVVVPPTILVALLAWPHLQLARGGAGAGAGVGGGRGEKIHPWEREGRHT